MKSFTTIFTLFTAALATPAIQTRQTTLPTVNFSVIDDTNGANAPGSVVANGVALRFGDAFVGTPIDKNGAIIATSLQSTTVTAGVFCIVQDGEGSQVGLINEQNTFVDLDGNKDKAVETDVTEFTILCEA